MKNRLKTGALWRIGFMDRWITGWMKEIGEVLAAEGTIPLWIPH